MDTTTRYYLIREQYVGPNRRDSSGSYYPDGGEMVIATAPGRTNMSHEERVEGWLGTSNDWSSWAHGSYETLEQAREAAAALGYVSEVEVDRYDWRGHGEDVAEVYRTEAGGRDQWDAGDWLGSVSASEIGITAETTDAEIEALAETLEAEARANGAELHGTIEALEYWREQARAQED